MLPIAHMHMHEHDEAKMMGLGHRQPTWRLATLQKNFLLAQKN